MQDAADARDRPTSELVLDVAETLARSKGYNGFSYADIAAALGVSKATIHHHFATKADLGLALVDRFSKIVLDALADIRRRSDDASDNLRGYFEIYLGALRVNRMCLCGMFAAEHESISPEMLAATTVFFDDHVDWLEEVLTRGRNAGRLAAVGEAREDARAILAAMQGGLLIAKSQGSARFMEELAETLLDTYGAGPDAAEAT